MQCRELIADGLARVDENLRARLEGLSAEELARRPGPKANPIGWMAWHLTRVVDHHLSELAGQPQAWIADGWHQRFGRPSDPGDTGYGQMASQVAAFRVPAADVLLEYYAVVHRRAVAYLETLTCDDLDRVIDTRWNPPVTLGVRLVSVVDDCAQHVGQIGYVRGLIAG